MVSPEEVDIRNYQHHEGIPYGFTYLMPAVKTALRDIPPPANIFELGCGNGTMAAALNKLGYEVTAVDPSSSGISHARKQFPSCRFEEGSAYDDLVGIYGKFDVVVSLEVIEHVFYPRKYAATVANLLVDNGIAIISTPYHGYLKNLAVALTNKWDQHHDPLWDFGHIKFWSRETLRKLFSEVELELVDFYRVGRIPPLAKSMIAVFKKG